MKHGVRAVPPCGGPFFYGDLRRFIVHEQEKYRATGAALLMNNLTTVSGEEGAVPHLDMGFKHQRGSDALPIPQPKLLPPYHSIRAELKTRSEPNHTYARCLRLSLYLRVTTYSPPFRRRSPYSPVDKGQTSSTRSAFTRTERCI